MGSSGWRGSQGVSEVVRRVVDVYSVVDGDYRGSFLFPGDVTELVMICRMADWRPSIWSTSLRW